MYHGLARWLLWGVGSLAVAGLVVHLVAGVALGTWDRDRAIMTALVGWLTWFVAGPFVGWLPVLGPLLALGVWIGAARLQYADRWWEAVLVGGATWAAIVALTAALAVAGLVGSRFGVPIV